MAPMNLGLIIIDIFYIMHESKTRTTIKSFSLREDIAKLISVIAERLMISQSGVIRLLVKKHAEELDLN